MRNIIIMFFIAFGLIASGCMHHKHAHKKHHKKGIPDIYLEQEMYQFKNRGAPPQVQIIPEPAAVAPAPEPEKPSQPIPEKPKDESSWWWR